MSPAPLTATWKDNLTRLQADLEQMPNFHPNFLKAYSQGKYLLKLIDVSPLDMKQLEMGNSNCTFIKFSQMYCLIAIIKSLGHKEAGLIEPPQVQLQNSILLWLY